MNADLYVYAGSFENDGSIGDVELIRKLEVFRNLTQNVSTSDNTFHVNFNELFETKITEGGHTFHDAIRGKIDGPYGKLYQKLITGILTTGRYIDESTPGCQIDKWIGLHDKTCCSAKVVLSEKNVYDRESQMVGTYDDWVNFRSHFLGLYPGDVEAFYKECSRLYPSIVFSDCYKNGTEEVLASHSERIANGLLAIERNFLQTYKSYSGNNIDFPYSFAMANEFDDGSFEGKNQNKKVFKIQFDGIGILNCEPHLKFNKPDDRKLKGNPDVNKYCRIYFHIPTPENQDKIYIGALVRHL